MKNAQLLFTLNISMEGCMFLPSMHAKSRITSDVVLVLFWGDPKKQHSGRLLVFLMIILDRFPKDAGVISSTPYNEHFLSVRCYQLERNTCTGHEGSVEKSFDRDGVITLGLRFALRWVA
jgi:hypothetical protein